LMRELEMAKPSCPRRPLVTQKSSQRVHNNDHLGVEAHPVDT